MFDDDINEVGLSVITHDQFVKKEAYWSSLWSNNDLPDDDGYVVWSSVGRRVCEEAPYRTLPFDFL